MSSGKIILIPSPISDTNLDIILPAYLLRTLEEIDFFFVENIRSSRRFLSKVGIKNIQDLHFEILDKHTDTQKIESMLSIVRQGQNVGVMSEAGCPGIADPGSKFIRLAHKFNITITPITGPSSIFLALMSSGFNGQSFQFHGYLPIDKKEREKRIIQLEKMVYIHDQTQIFMETPYRNNQILHALLKFLKPETSLCIASHITSSEEYIKTKSIKSWKKEIPDLHKKPTIFLIYK
jgi:16S rRNA (cytidine1402-2'-O)-methyltransferase